MEYGIVGFLILLVMIAFISINTKKITPPLLCILSIAIFSCFSYPTRYACVLLLLAYSLASLQYDGGLTRRFNVIDRIIGLGIVGALSFILVRDIKFETQWGNLVKLSSMGKAGQLLESYETLHYKWNGNPLFLYNYGAIFNNIGNYESSIAIIEQCEMYYNDYDVQMIMGNNYFNSHCNQEALSSYTEASHMCPNRFMPLYRIFQLYNNDGQTEDAYQLARHIIEKPIKINSPVIAIIIREAQEYINQYNLKKHESAE